MGVWGLQHSGGSIVLVLAVAATAGSLLSMASKDRIVALGMRPPRERRPWSALGGRDGRLLLVAVFAVLGQPLTALVAVVVTSAMSLVFRVVAARTTGAPPVTDR